ncbi:MAG: PrsW family glutamic-type intramembrane protease [Bacilli bacterium]
MTNNILCFTLCIVPSLLLMWYIYIKDKIEKEPPYLLLILYVAGIVSAVISYLISTTLKIYLPFLNNTYSNMNVLQILFKSFIVIAFVEETSKWLINYICTWKNKNFNHLYDPIVYATFISLGFATFENILYGFAYRSFGLMPIILRGVISVPCHAVFGIIMGYYLGIAKNSIASDKLKQSKKYKFKSLIIPILLHLIYDLLLINSTKIYYCLFIFYIITLYAIAFIKIRKLCGIKKKI